MYNFLAVTQEIFRHLHVWQILQLPIKQKLWIMVSFLFFTMVACAYRSTVEPTTVSTTLPVTITMTGSSSTIFFPQQKPVNGERASMTAELIGKLVLVDNCLRVNAMYFDASYLLIWPPDFKLDIENNVIQVINGTGQVIARINDEINTGGGEVPDSHVPQEIRDTCPGPYFEVGEWVSTPMP